MPRGILLIWPWLVFVLMFVNMTSWCSGYFMWYVVISLGHGHGPTDIALLTAKGFIAPGSANGLSSKSAISPAQDNINTKVKPSTLPTSKKLYSLTTQKPIQWSKTVQKAELQALSSSHDHGTSDMGSKFTWVTCARTS